jgi:hypothetical protein
MGQLRFLLIAVTALAAPATAERSPSAANTRAVLEALSVAPDADRPAWRWRLARDYAARGLAAEADGVLRVIAADTPLRSDAADFRLLHASVLTTLGDAEAALALLDSPAVEGVAEACRQRMRASARLGRHADVLRNFACSGTRRATDVMAAVRASVALGDDTGASRLLDRMTALPPRLAGEAAFWRGAIARRRGQPALAAAQFAAAAASPNPVAALRATVALSELRVDAGTLSPAAALAELDRLRHARRGGIAERELLMAAGRLSDRVGDIRGVFENYGTVALYHDAPGVRRTLDARFQELFADGGASLAPVDAFALFWDFREFAPQGPAADAMVRRIADRLARLGLNAQAASLLEHQVYNRLDGTARAIVAVQLAGLLNAGGHHARALAVLSDSAASDLPAETLDRFRLERAAALIGVGKPAAARALLAEATGPAARRLRTEAAWAARDWAAVIELAVGDLPSPDAAAGDLVTVLRVTVAAAMDGDDALLSRLRSRYRQALAQTDAAAAFDALTGDPARIDPVQLRAALALAAARATKPLTGGSAA